MSDDMLNLTVILTVDPELDPEANERLTRHLRTEIAELDVESVRHAPAAVAPHGSKGTDPVTLGAIIVAMSASGGVLTSVLGTVRDWLGRHTRRHRITMSINGDTIELEQATVAQQQALIEAYVQRHTADM